MRETGNEGLIYSFMILSIGAFGRYARSGKFSILSARGIAEACTETEIIIKIKNRTCFLQKDTKAVRVENYT